MEGNSNEGDITNGLKRIHIVRRFAVLLTLGFVPFSVVRKRVKVRSKGEKTRIIPIVDDEFLSDLKHLIGTREDGPVFLSNQGKSVSIRLVNHIIEKVGALSSIENPHPGRPHLNPHIFRHSIARFLKSKGSSAEWIQNFLGHESYKTTMDMYGTISIDEMQEIAERKLGEGSLI